MTKSELEKLLKETKAPVNEGVPSDKNREAPVRICFWDYLWEDLIASSDNYNTKVTYQISIIADKPRSEVLLNLKHKLNNMDIFPVIQHEYDIEERRWHSYFALEVLENV